MSVFTPFGVMACFRLKSQISAEALRSPTLRPGLRAPKPYPSAKKSQLYTVGQKDPYTSRTYCGSDGETDARYT